MKAAPSKAKPDSRKAERPLRVDSTLSKGLQVLEALARSKSGKGVTELSRELALTKSNTFRLLRTLTALGYVRNSESRSYSATMKVWQVGLSVIGNLDLPRIAAPQMRMLSRETGEAIYLAVPDVLSVIYIDKIESTKPIRSWNPIGGSAPIHCVGTGKALLAADYDRLRDQVRGRLTRFTDRTITSIKRLDADVAETRARGYAVDRGEYRERIFSFGAVLRLPNGQPVAAIGVSLPDVNLTEGRDAEIGALLLRAADEVSESLKGV